MAEQPVGHGYSHPAQLNIGSGYRHPHCFLSCRFCSTARPWRGCCQARHCLPHSTPSSETGWPPPGRGTALCLSSQPLEQPVTDHGQWDFHLLPAEASWRARLEDTQPGSVLAWEKSMERICLMRCFFCAQPMGLPFGVWLQTAQDGHCVLPSTQAQACTCIWMQAGRRMGLWLNMGFSILFPAATVTSLLDDDGKPTSMLLVGNMVTVLAPGGAWYLAGCSGQGSFVLGNLNPFNLLPLVIKLKV